MGSNEEHDPLCDMAGRTAYEVYVCDIGCHCDNIADVRADERRKVSEEIAQAIEHELDLEFRLDGWRSSVVPGLRIAAAIARRIGSTS